MQIQIYPPLAFSEIGQRQNNEDAIFPDIETANDQQKLFLVCDGVGGMNKGEVASNLACQIFAKYIAENPNKSTREYIQNAIKEVQKSFSLYESQHQTAQGMATTLTMLHIHESGITLAHVGDSRIYHIRNGKILYKSDDHSLVNEYLKHKLITPEQAVYHPQRHIILQAIQTNREVKADICLSTDIEAEDYFFLCTDGVLEHLTDAALCAILSQHSSDKEKIEAIKNYSQGNTQDNFSAYLICILDKE
jgi:serine/threonine protein phosphatase PrpC